MPEPASRPAADLDAAADALGLADRMSWPAAWPGSGRPPAAVDAHQVVAYDLAHAAAAAATARAALDYGAAGRHRGPHRLRLRGRRRWPTCGRKLLGREAAVGDRAGRPRAGHGRSSTT